MSEISEERKAILDIGFEKFDALVADGREKIADNPEAEYIAVEVAKRYTPEEFGLYVISSALATNDLINDAYGEGYYAGTVDAAARIGGQLQAAGITASVVEGQPTVDVIFAEQPVEDESTDDAPAA